MCGTRNDGAPSPALAGWQQNGLGLLRIAFGVVWAIDASFKWQPAFVHGFTGYLKGAMDGQPQAVQDWIGFWIGIVQTEPHLFARLVAVTETLLAIALILGVLTNLACVGGAALSLMIWSTAEGFGGPYAPGATDIGTSIIYVFVFAALLLTSAGRYLGLDRRLGPMLKCWALLASGGCAGADAAATTRARKVP
jgi:thiosulfate dehydrogenase [quinone] large subunit